MAAGSAARSNIRRMRAMIPGGAADAQEADRDLQAGRGRWGPTVMTPSVAADGDGAGVLLARDRLDAGDSAQGEKREHSRPVIGRLVGQAQRHGAGRAHRLVGALQPAQGARRAVVELLEGLVEPPHAAEAGGHRHLGHRQARLADQLLGQQHPPGLGHRDGGGAEMLPEQPPQLPARRRRGVRPGPPRRPRRARRPRSGQGRGRRCWRRRARRRGQATFPAGSAGRGGSRPPAPPRRCGRSARSDASACRPGRSAGSRAPVVFTAVKNRPSKRASRVAKGAVAGVVVHFHNRQDGG